MWLERQSKLKSPVITSPLHCLKCLYDKEGYYNQQFATTILLNPAQGWRTNNHEGFQQQQGN